MEKKKKKKVSLSSFLLDSHGARRKSMLVAKSMEFTHSI
jgi:hypothetical protein